MPNARTRSFREIYGALCADKKIKPCPAVLRFCNDAAVDIRAAEEIPFDHWDLIALALRQCHVADVHIITLALSLPVTTSANDSNDNSDDDNNDDRNAKQPAPLLPHAADSDKNPPPPPPKPKPKPNPRKRHDVFDVFWEKLGVDLTRQRPFVLSRVSCGIVQVVQTSPQLRRLELSSIPFGDENVCRVMRMLADPVRGVFDQLETVVLAMVQLTDKAVPLIIESLLRLPRLREVSLAGNYLSDESTPEIVKLLRPSPYAGRADRMWVSSLRRSAAASSTSGSGSGGTHAPAAITASASSSPNASPERSSGEHMAASSHLVRLDLSYNEFTDSTLVKLADIFEEGGGGRLEMLNLCGNHFRCVGHITDLLPTPACPAALCRVQFAGIPAEMLPESIPRCRWTAEFDPASLKLVFLAAARSAEEQLAAAETMHNAAAAKRMRDAVADSADEDAAAAASAAAAATLRLSAGPKRKIPIAESASTAQQQQQQRQHRPRPTLRPATAAAAASTSSNKKKQQQQQQKQQKQQKQKIEADDDEEAFALSETVATESIGRQSDDDDEFDEQTNPISVDDLMMLAAESRKQQQPQTTKKASVPQQKKTTKKKDESTPALASDSSSSSNKKKKKKKADENKTKEKEKREEYSDDEDFEQESDHASQKAAAADQLGSDGDGDDDSAAAHGEHAAHAAATEALEQQQRYLEQAVLALRDTHDIEMQGARKLIGRMQKQLHEQRCTMAEQEERFAAFCDHLLTFPVRTTIVKNNTVREEPIVVVASQPTAATASSEAADGSDARETQQFARALRSMMLNLAKEVTDTNHPEQPESGVAAADKSENQTKKKKEKKKLKPTFATRSDLFDGTVADVCGRLDELGW